MKVRQFNQPQSNFKGGIKISGPNPSHDVIINSQNISTLNPTKYVGHDFQLKDGSIVVMNNDSTINTYLPLRVVSEFYQKALASNNSVDIKTPYNPLFTTPLFG